MLAAVEIRNVSARRGVKSSDYLLHSIMTAGLPGGVDQTRAGVRECFSSGRCHSHCPGRVSGRKILDPGASATPASCNQGQRNFRHVLDASEMCAYAPTCRCAKPHNNAVGGEWKLVSGEMSYPLEDTYSDWIRWTTLLQSRPGRPGE